jgi:hypothetical protein
MTDEQFKTAKAIEAEIKEIVNYIGALKSNRANVGLYVSGRTVKENGQLGDYHEKSYRNDENAPDFLKEYIGEELTDISDRIQRKAERRLAELEKAFTKI